MVSLLCLDLRDEWMGFGYSDHLAISEEKPGNKESGELTTEKFYETYNECQLASLFQNWSTTQREKLPIVGLKVNGLKVARKV